MARRSGHGAPGSRAPARTAPHGGRRPRQERLDARLWSGGRDRLCRIGRVAERRDRVAQRCGARAAARHRRPSGQTPDRAAPRHRAHESRRQRRARSTSCGPVMPGIETSVTSTAKCARPRACAALLRRLPPCARVAVGLEHALNHAAHQLVVVHHQTARGGRNGDGRGATRPCEGHAHRKHLRGSNLCVELRDDVVHGRKPGPLPVALVVKNGSKMRRAVSGDMPTPVSFTVSAHSLRRPRW